MSAKPEAPFDAVLWAVAEAQSFIPLGKDKKPLVPWKEYQTRLPTPEEIAAWKKKRPSAWGLVTGALSRRISIDFDGETGASTMRKLGIDPHRRSPSGGYHADFKYPGWHVPTLNSKSKRELGARWPGVDIRGDGGYIGIAGRAGNGSYQWLRDPKPYSVDVLPDDFRAALGLLRAPAQPNGPGRVDAERLVRMALDHVATEGRNNAGFWLALQLRDNKYNETEAAGVMRKYRDRCPETNAKGQREPYTDQELMNTLRGAYSRAPREPWSEKGRAPSRAPRPCGESELYTFECDDAGLRAIDRRNSGVVPIGPPLRIDARTQDAAGEGCGKRVIFCDWRGRERTCVIPLQQLVGDNREGIDRLLTMGYKPRPERKALALLK